jgi:predicted TIM-barrel fold metal-dependent hydrolase
VVTPVIDFHIHLVKYESHHPWAVEFIEKFRPDNYQNFIEEMSKPDAFAELLRENGVDYGVILPEICPITTGVCSNEDVAAFCRDYDCLIPFGTVNPFMTARPAELVEKLVKDDGFKGLKLYPTYSYFYPNDQMMYPIYAKAQDLGIPVMFHTGTSIFRGSRVKFGDPVFFDDIAVDFPELTIIMAHSGRNFWYDTAFALSKLHPNLYMEIAGLPPQNLLNYFPNFAANADRILFGTDWAGIPGTIKDNIDEFKKLPIPEDAKTKILGKNAAKILGLHK